MFPDAPPIDRPGIMRRLITLEDLHQHVLNLAADLRIVWSAWWAKADPDIGTVTLRPIKSEKAYALALHEIGHFGGLHIDHQLQFGRVWSATTPARLSRRMRSLHAHPRCGGGLESAFLPRLQPRWVSGRP
jgi:hypothetical protein